MKAIRWLPLMALVAGFPAMAAGYTDHARVVEVTPRLVEVNHPRQECYDEYVPGRYRGPERDVTGALIGGIAGGLLGSRVGKGNGRVAAAAVGAATGAVVGDRMQNSPAYHDGGREVRRCRMVDSWETSADGYRVIYEYAGREYTTILPYDPGPSLPVRVSVTPR